MTFNPLRVKSKGRFFVPLACIAALLVTHVTSVLAADSRAAPAMEAEAMKQPAMDYDTQYAAFEDLASHHRFQRHEEQLEMRALSENEKDDGKSQARNGRWHLASFMPVRYDHKTALVSVLQAA